MIRDNKTLKPKNKIYYRTIPHNNGHFITACFDNKIYDEISMTPICYERYEDVLKQLMKAYKVILIGDENYQTKGNNNSLFVTPPQKIEYTLKTELVTIGGFKIVISKRFIMKNKSKFLDLLGKLFSENFIESIRGSLSYDKDSEHVYINLNNAFEGSSGSVWNNIYLNYDNIKCLFKHRFKDIATLFYETKSISSKFVKKPKEIFEYEVKVTGNIDKRSLSFPILESIDESGKVKIRFAYNKFSILSREIYAETLGEGIDILHNEMKNLGLEIEIIENSKRKLLVR